LTIISGVQEFNEKVASSISEQKMSDGVLARKISKGNAENLLLDLANIPADWSLMRGESDAAKVARIWFRDTSAYVVKKYPEVFLSLPFPVPSPRAKHKIHPSNWYILAKLQRFVCLAWDAPGVREREWYIFQARFEHHLSTVYYPLRDKRVEAAGDEALASDSAPVSAARYEFDRRPAEEELVRIGPPALTPFEQVMYHFHRIADSARHCANPECATPYFFAKRRGQKFCSSECAAPAQREHKRNWWKRNGVSWRRNRAKQKQAKTRKP